MDEFSDWLPSSPMWEEWYAWYPVKDVHGIRHWLKKIYRRYNWAKSSSFPFGKEYDYGTLFDVLAEEHKPEAAPIGSMRINITTNNTEIYDGTAWITVVK